MPGCRRFLSLSSVISARSTSFDEALAAVSIADAPHQDLEFVVVAAHGSLWYCRMARAEKSLEKSSFLPSSGTADRPTPRGKLGHVNGLGPGGGIPFIMP
jgi:hypothetical protein